MDLGLRDRRALIGGGSGGLGGAIAEVLRAEGAQRRADGRARATGSMPRRTGSARWRSRPTSRRRTGPPRRSPRRSRRSAASTCWSSTPAARRPGRFEDLDEAAWQTRHRRHAVERRPPPPGGAAASPRGPRPGHPGHPVELGARADPRPDDLEPASGPGWPASSSRWSRRSSPVRINGLAPGRFDTDRIAQLDAGRATAAGVERRGDPAPHDRADPARALRRPARARPARGVPALAGGVLRDRRDRPGRRRDDPGPALGRGRGQASASPTRSRTGRGRRSCPGPAPAPGARSRSDAIAPRRR